MNKNEVRNDVLGMRVVNISELNAFQGNLKELSDENYLKLKKDILELGFSEAFTAWSDNGTLKLLNGHQRLKALTRMSSEGVSVPPLPVQIVNAASEKEAAMKVLSLTSQFGEITDLGLKGFISDFKLEFDEVKDSFRFPEIDFEKFEASFIDDEKREMIEDVLPAAPVEPVSKLGDIYELGNHRLMCGDSTDEATVLKLIDGKSIDLVFTDPPYGISYDDTKHKDYENFKANNFGMIIGDNQQFDFKKFSFLNIENQVWFGANYYCKTLDDYGSWYVWDKKTEAMQDNKMLFTNDFEIAWSKVKRKQEIARFKWAGAINKEKGEERLRPTQKPIALIEWFFDRFNGPNVLDLFGGSGSTLIACEKTKRNCFIMEIDPKYVDVIVSRFCKYTGNNIIKRNGQEMTWIA